MTETSALSGRATAIGQPGRNSAITLHLTPDELNLITAALNTETRRLMQDNDPALLVATRDLWLRLLDVERSYWQAAAQKRLQSP